MSDIDVLTALGVMLAALVLLGDRFMKMLNAIDYQAEKKLLGPLGLIEALLLGITGILLILSMIAIAVAGPNRLAVHGIWIAAVLYGLSVFTAINIRERVALWHQRQLAMKLLYQRLDSNVASTFEDVIFRLRAKDLNGASRAGRQVLQAWARSNELLPEDKTIDDLMFESPPPTRPANLVAIYRSVLDEVSVNKLKELWAVDCETTSATHSKHLYAYLRILWRELVDRHRLPPEL